MVRLFPTSIYLNTLTTSIHLPPTTRRPYQYGISPKCLVEFGLMIGIPAIGWLLDTRPMRDVIIILGLMGISFGALTLTSTIIPQLIGIGVLVVARPLFYTAISDYAAKVFGYVPLLSLLLISPHPHFTSPPTALRIARRKRLIPDSKPSGQSTA